MFSAISAALKSLRPSSAPCRSARQRRPLIESMEGRCLMATNYALVDAASIVEGSGGGTTEMSFTVRLMAPASGDVKLNYSTAGSSATAGTDFTAVKGTLVIPSGHVSTTVKVPVAADNVIESNEFLGLSLSSPVNAVLVRSSATGSICDDDAPVAPEITITDEAISRGYTGSKTMTFKVVLNTTVSTPVTVRATTESLTALAGKDFEHKSELLTFAPGQRIKEFTVKVFGTSAYTSTKVFGVRLTQATLPIKKSMGFGSIKFGP